MARRTLVDQLRRNVRAADDRGPDWVTAVEVAMRTQDMEWELDVWAAANTPPPRELVAA